MISKERLLAAMTQGRVAFDTDGNPVDLPEIDGGSEATALVAPVTDAVKRLREEIVESLDRDGIWAVEVMILERVVVDALGSEEMSAGELWRAVTDAGYDWLVSPTSAP